MTRPLRFLAAVLLASGLIAAWSQLRLERAAEERCAWDGARVRVSQAVEWKGQSAAMRFCTIDCATAWRRARPARAETGRFVVRDATTGQPLAAEVAHYVEVPARSGEDGFTRAFRRWQDATGFRRATEGRLVRNPFDSGTP